MMCSRLCVRTFGIVAEKWELVFRSVLENQKKRFVISCAWVFPVCHVHNFTLFICIVSSESVR